MNSVVSVNHPENQTYNKNLTGLSRQGASSFKLSSELGLEKAIQSKYKNTQAFDVSSIPKMNNTGYMLDNKNSRGFKKVNCQDDSNQLRDTCISGAGDWKSENYENLQNYKSLDRKVSPPSLKNPCRSRFEKFYSKQKYPKVSTTSADLSTGKLLNKLKSYVFDKYINSNSETKCHQHEHFKFEPKSLQEKNNLKKCYFPNKVNHEPMKKCRNCAYSQHQLEQFDTFRDTKIRNFNKLSGPKKQSQNGNEIKNILSNISLRSDNSCEEVHAIKRFYTNSGESHSNLAEKLIHRPITNLMYCKSTHANTHDTGLKGIDQGYSIRDEELYSSFKSYIKGQRGNDKNADSRGVDPKTQFNNRFLRAFGLTDGELHKRDQKFLDEILDKILPIQECGVESTRLTKAMNQFGGISPDIQNHRIPFPESGYIAPRSCSKKRKLSNNDIYMSEPTKECKNSFFNRFVPTKTEYSSNCDEFEKYHEDYCLDPEETALLRGYNTYDQKTPAFEPNVQLNINPDVVGPSMPLDRNQNSNDMNESHLDKEELEEEKEQERRSSRPFKLIKCVASRLGLLGERRQPFTLQASDLHNTSNKIDIKAEIASRQNVAEKCKEPAKQNFPKYTVPHRKSVSRGSKEESKKVTASKSWKHLSENRKSRDNTPKSTKRSKSQSNTLDRMSRKKSEPLVMDDGFSSKNKYGSQKDKNSRCEKNTLMYDKYVRKRPNSQNEKPDNKLKKETNDGVRSFQTKYRKGLNDAQGCAKPSKVNKAGNVKDPVEIQKCELKERIRQRSKFYSNSKQSNRGDEKQTEEITRSDKINNPKQLSYNNKRLNTRSPSSRPNHTKNSPIRKEISSATPTKVMHTGGRGESNEKFPPAKCSRNISNVEKNKDRYNSPSQNGNKTRNLEQKSQLGTVDIKNNKNKIKETEKILRPSIDKNGEFIDSNKINKEPSSNRHTYEQNQEHFEKSKNSKGISQHESGEKQSVAQIIQKINGRENKVALVKNDQPMKRENTTTMKPKSESKEHAIESDEIDISNLQQANGCKLVAEPMGGEILATCGTLRKKLPMGVTIHDDVFTSSGNKARTLSREFTVPAIGGYKPKIRSIKKPVEVKPPPLGILKPKILNSYLAPLNKDKKGESGQIVCKQKQKTPSDKGLCKLIQDQKHEIDEVSTSPKQLDSNGDGDKIIELKNTDNSNKSSIEGDTYIGKERMESPKRTTYKTLITKCSPPKSRENSPTPKCRSPKCWSPNLTSPKLGTTNPTSPKLATPNLTSPKLATPNLALTNLATPNLSSPKLATPNLTSPKLATPNLTSPKLATPNLTSPKLATPNLALTKLATPNLVLTNLATPNLASPKLATPNLSSPKLATPNLASPKQGTPNVASPKLATPNLASPKQGTPNLASPKLATPKLASPKQGTPNLASLKLASPNLASPKQGMPNLASPKQGTPNLASQKLTTPNLASPKLSKQNFTSPKLATPNLASPKLATPNLSSPKLATPNHEAPKLATPNLTSPKLATTKFASPKQGTPNIESTKYGTPNFSSPKLATPNLESTELGTPNLASPKLGSPNLASSKLGSPNLASSKVGTPNLASPKQVTPKLGTPNLASPKLGIQNLTSPKNGTPKIGTSKESTSPTRESSLVRKDNKQSPKEELNEKVRKWVNNETELFGVRRSIREQCKRLVEGIKHDTPIEQISTPTESQNISSPKHAPVPMQKENKDSSTEVLNETSEQFSSSASMSRKEISMSTNEENKESRLHTYTIEKKCTPTKRKNSASPKRASTPVQKQTIKSIKTSLDESISEASTMMQCGDGATLKQEETKNNSELGDINTESGVTAVESDYSEASSDSLDDSSDSESLSYSAGLESNESNTSISSNESLSKINNAEDESTISGTIGRLLDFSGILFEKAQEKMYLKRDKSFQKENDDDSIKTPKRPINCNNTRDVSAYFSASESESESSIQNGDKILMPSGSRAYICSNSPRCNSPKQISYISSRNITKCERSENSDSSESDSSIDFPALLNSPTEKVKTAPCSNSSPKVETSKAVEDSVNDRLDIDSKTHCIGSEDCLNTKTEEWETDSESCTSSSSSSACFDETEMVLDTSMILQDVQYVSPKISKNDAPNVLANLVSPKHGTPKLATTKEERSPTREQSPLRKDNKESPKQILNEKVRKWVNNETELFGVRRNIREKCKSLSDKLKRSTTSVINETRYSASESSISEDSSSVYTSSSDLSVQEEAPCIQTENGSPARGETEDQPEEIETQASGDQTKIDKSEEEKINSSKYDLHANGDVSEISSRKYGSSVDDLKYCQQEPELPLKRESSSSLSYQSQAANIYNRTVGSISSFVKQKVDDLSQSGLDEKVEKLTSRIIETPKKVLQETITLCSSPRVKRIDRPAPKKLDLVGSEGAVKPPYRHTNRYLYQWNLDQSDDEFKPRKKSKLVTNGLIQTLESRLDMSEPVQNTKESDIKSHSPSPSKRVSQTTNMKSPLSKMKTGQRVDESNAKHDSPSPSKQVSRTSNMKSSLSKTKTGEMVEESYVKRHSPSPSKGVSEISNLNLKSKTGQSVDESKIKTDSISLSKVDSPKSNMKTPPHQLEKSERVNSPKAEQDCVVLSKSPSEESNTSSSDIDSALYESYNQSSEGSRAKQKSVSPSNYISPKSNKESLTNKLTPVQTVCRSDVKQENLLLSKVESPKSNMDSPSHRLKLEQSACGSKTNKDNVSGQWVKYVSPKSNMAESKDKQDNAAPSKDVGLKSVRELSSELSGYKSVKSDLNATRKSEVEEESDTSFYQKIKEYFVNKPKVYTTESPTRSVTDSKMAPKIENIAKVDEGSGYRKILNKSKEKDTDVPPRLTSCKNKSPTPQNNKSPKIHNKSLNELKKRLETLEVLCQQRNVETSNDDPLSDLKKGLRNFEDRLLRLESRGQPEKSEMKAAIDEVGSEFRKWVKNETELFGVRRNIRKTCTRLVEAGGGRLKRITKPIKHDEIDSKNDESDNNSESENDALSLEQVLQRSPSTTNPFNTVSILSRNTSVAESIGSKDTSLCGSRKSDSVILSEGNNSIDISSSEELGNPFCCSNIIGPSMPDMKPGPGDDRKDCVSDSSSLSDIPLCSLLEPEFTCNPVVYHAKKGLPVVKTLRSSSLIPSPSDPACTYVKCDKHPQLQSGSKYVQRRTRYGEHGLGLPQIMPSKGDSDIHLNLLQLFYQIDKLEADMGSAFDAQSINQEIQQSLSIEDVLRAPSLPAVLQSESSDGEEDDGNDEYGNMYAIMQPSFPEEEFSSRTRDVGATRQKGRPIAQEISDYPLDSAWRQYRPLQRKIMQQCDYELGSSVEVEGRLKPFIQVMEPKNEDSEIFFNRVMNISKSNFSVPYPEYCSSNSK